MSKRAYRSDLRAAQALRTRGQIVAAAAELFVGGGYAATTIDAIAAAAGVSRKTVFTSAGGKAELLKLAYDHATAGDDEPVPLRERPVVKALEAEPDAARMLAGFAAMVTGIQGRIAPLHVALAGAAESDPEARTLFEHLEQQRLTAMQRPATLLSSRGALRDDLTVEMAADILWLHNDPGLYHRLVHKRRWTPAQFQDWLTRALQTQLLR
ncbi:TetR family transcriptional regulator [Dactylosporangium sp. NBC_01737]|uniref:TetR/AcrR family transcriptional regulator n=1 Tax=Dactylosporangium sp. NBC_01737 TaxID=2975959 RepID=UPI002E164975|nr:TetR family transcriptional regulator [Dactylosporangium sp. NBC_01737]